MPTAPAKPVSKHAGRLQALYRTTLQEAAAGGTVLMGRMVEAARQVLQAQEAALRDPVEREALATASNQLRRQEQHLCSSFPAALLKAFAGPEGGKKSSTLSVADIKFDQLELMDDVQVLTSVTLARVQNFALQAAEISLSELNPLICSLQGMGTVRAEHNPLRPEVYVNALKDVVEQTQLPASMQMLWFNAMSTTLGPELRALYQGLCKHLREQGVTRVSYSAPVGFGNQGGALGTGSPTRYSPDSAGRSAQADRVGQAARYGQGERSPDADRFADADQEFGWQTQAAPLSEDFSEPAPLRVGGRDEALLTLDKLRRLLSGELVAFPSLNRVEKFAAQFSQQFENSSGGATESPRTGFDATVPAALEALTEMKQVERVVQSLEQRRSFAGTAQDPQAHTVEGQRLALRSGARDIAQALSLEVVTLMVDNMARDPRLLEPVCQVVRNLEPALLRLALVDPRFFTDKQHPARRLLHELTHHSLAFESVSAPGFDSFIRVLQNALSPLFQAPIENAEIFEAKLSGLRAQWDLDTQSTLKERELAVDVLQHAEARNLLAEKIARGIEAHPDSAKVPAVVIDFLCGPWAQVVAQARIKEGSGSAAAERFEALVPALLWSAHPELARASPAKLTRVLPRLLATLREGLETIHYPATRSSIFLEALMVIHQKVFRANVALESVAAVDNQQVDVALSDRVHPVVDGNPWIAPEEALASNFVELQDMPSDPMQAGGPGDADAPELSAMELGSGSDFSLGSWVEMWVNGQWIRTQLTWASPHGTLFLFTGVFGTTQSMTRRSRDKLLSSGRLRLVSGQAVDEGALNAVAQTAMRNSLDSVL